MGVLKSWTDELQKPNSSASFQFVLSDDSTAVQIEVTCGQIGFALKEKGIVVAPFSVL